MYDASFDHERSGLRRFDRGALWLLRIAALLAAAAAGSADAQIPGSPVLQNAWATPGIVSAINITGGSDGTLYAAAGSWTPESNRFQLSGGAGYQTRTGASSAGAYGARLAVPIAGATGTFGFSGFVGVGGGPRDGSTTNITVLPSGVVLIDRDSAASKVQVAGGLGIGWRHALGAKRGLSVYSTPSYIYYSGGSNPGGLFRTAIAADVGINSSLGATAGIEFGATRHRSLGGPSGILYGVGVSYVLGRR